MDKILVILDGAADLPHPVLDDKTALEAANLPNLDFFAREGRMGYMYPISEKVIPESSTAIISILGNNYRLCKRGVYEAIGAGLKLNRGDLAIRANFSSIDNLESRKVIDRRAGRTLSFKEVKVLSDTVNKYVELPCEFEFIPTIHHRAVLVLRGGFSDNITDIDITKKESEHFEFSHPLDKSDLAEYSAKIVNEFFVKSFEVLRHHPINKKRAKKGLFPANAILLRGAGTEIPPLKKYPLWMSINYMPLEIGISKASKMKVFSFCYPPLKDIDFYRNIHKGLLKAISFAIKMLKRNHDDFVGAYVHFKEIDSASHDNKPLEKKKLLELLDAKFFKFLRKFALKKKIKVLIVADHTTCSKSKSHTSHRVPIVFFDLENKDLTKKFTEAEGRKGSLGKIYGYELFKKLKFDK